MTIQEIIRAWRDEAFRDSLSEEQRRALPNHPAGLIELTDEELGMVAGGTGHQCDTVGTLRPCTTVLGCGPTSRF